MSGRELYCQVFRLPEASHETASHVTSIVLKPGYRLASATPLVMEDGDDLLVVTAEADGSVPKAEADEAVSQTSLYTNQSGKTERVFRLGAAPGSVELLTAGVSTRLGPMDSVAPYGQTIAHWNGSVKHLAMELEGFLTHGQLGELAGILLRRLTKPALDEPVVHWRGSCSDFAKDTAALVTDAQLAEVTCELAAVWRTRRHSF